MSKFTVFTLFPEQIENALSHSIMKRAMEDEKLSLNCVNIRDFTEDPHGHVDDAPFGGGAGMLMQVQPIVSAFEDLVKREGRPDRVPGGRYLSKVWPWSWPKRSIFSFFAAIMKA